MSSGVNLTSWEEGASLALVGYPSSDGVTINIPYGVVYYINQPHTPSFFTGLFKIESDFIVRSVEMELGRWMLVVAVVSVLCIFQFLRSNLSPWGYRNACFLVTLCHLIVRRPNLRVVTKRFLHQNAEILG